MNYLQLDILFYVKEEVYFKQNTILWNWIKYMHEKLSQTHTLLKKMLRSGDQELALKINSIKMGDQSYYVVCVH